ncbi:MAG: AmmeMemoRadiSam system protein B [Treponema sp.]|nr:AmmeMemoRadiSam system protein B [Treponema sp.]
MTLRKRCLPSGWYPPDEAQVRAFLDRIPHKKHPRSALAAMAPHAGWFYSGKIAAAAVSALTPDADTIAVIGGHLPAGMPPLFAEEDGVATPLGNIEIDREFRELFRNDLASSVFSQKTAGDRYRDNTIEVLLPMAAYFFPHARLLPFRLPGESASFEAGKSLARIGRSLGRKPAVIGSTDLTHYGAPYGFSPQGKGKQALEWVKNMNDRAFIQAVIDGAPEQILERSDKDGSACSVGAVLGALGFAQASGADRGELLVYGTSADEGRGDQEIPESFVGYAAIAWRKP